MFEDKVVWITGGSSGIGRALADAFRKDGARLIISGRNQEALTKAQEELGGPQVCRTLAFDTVDFDRIPRIVEDANAAWGRIDVLVNNAGVSQRSFALNTKFEVYRELIDVDLLAPIALTQAVAPLMVAQGEGRIIAISSIAGKIGAPLRTAYSAAKHGVFGYFDSLRAELAASGIEVHVVAPGSVKTNIARNALTGAGTVRGRSDAAIDAAMSAEEFSRIMLREIARGRREIIIARGRERLAERLRRYFPEFAFKRFAAMTSAYAKELDVEP